MIYKIVSKIPDVLGNNTYSSLEVEHTAEDDEAAGHTLIEVDTSDNEDKNPSSKPKPANRVSEATIRASKKPEKEIRQQQQQQQENEKESQWKVEICGDSMTKYIQADKLGRSTNDTITSKSFSRGEV